jgi:hypothetical protein
MSEDLFESPLVQRPQPVGPQAGRRRMIWSHAVGWVGTGHPNPEFELLAQNDGQSVFMMGDNPALPKMPDRPTLQDFLRLRQDAFGYRHLTTSAKKAMEAGLDDKIILACLVHDIANGLLIRADHGYWGAQMIAPYVDEEVAFAVQYHQPLRYFADEAAGYPYPESYHRFFGADYEPPDYIRRDAAFARSHRWYMSARQVTLNDIYIMDNTETIDLEIFDDVIGRCFRTPEEGLGMDNSPSSHMWRTAIWPNNFL